MVEYYINELLSEGITYIPPWTAPVTPKNLEIKSDHTTDDTPSQDSGLRSRSNSNASQHSHSSQSSLVLGATAATINDKSPVIEGKIILVVYHS